MTLPLLCLRKSALLQHAVPLDATFDWLGPRGTRSEWDYAGLRGRELSERWADEAARLLTSTTKMQDIDEHTECLAAVLRCFVPNCGAHDAAAALSSPPPVRRVSPLPLGASPCSATCCVCMRLIESCAFRHHRDPVRSAFQRGDVCAGAVRAAEGRSRGRRSDADPRCAAARSAASRARRWRCVEQMHLEPRCCSLTIGAVLDGRRVRRHVATFVPSAAAAARPASQARTAFHSGRHE